MDICLQEMNLNLPHLVPVAHARHQRPRELVDRVLHRVRVHQRAGAPARRVHPIMHRKIGQMKRYGIRRMLPVCIFFPFALFLLSFKGRCRRDILPKHSLVQRDARPLCIVRDALQRLVLHKGLELVGAAEHVRHVCEGYT
jgi:hypothetical protein